MRVRVCLQLGEQGGRGDSHLIKALVVSAVAGFAEILLDLATVEVMVGDLKVVMDVVAVAEVMVVELMVVDLVVVMDVVAVDLVEAGMDVVAVA